MNFIAFLFSYCFLFQKYFHHRVFIVFGNLIQSNCNMESLDNLNENSSFNYESCTNSEQGNINNLNINSDISNNESNEDIPLLPPSIENNESLNHLSMALGETMKLDHFGPMIINPDGTVRRIANWDTLTKQEKDSSWRLITARNRKRLQELQRQQNENEASENNKILSNEEVN